MIPRLGQMPKRVGRRLCPSCFPSLLTRHTVRSATRNHCLDSFGLRPTLGWIDGFNPQHQGPAQGPMSAWACNTPWESVLANGVSLLARERITCLCTSSMRTYCAQSKHLACMRKPLVRGRSRHIRASLPPRLGASRVSRRTEGKKALEALVHSPDREDIPASCWIRRCAVSSVLPGLYAPK